MVKLLVVFFVLVASVYGKPQVPVYSYSYSTVVQHGVPYPLASYKLTTQPQVVEVPQPSESHPPVSRGAEVPVKNVTKEIEQEVEEKEGTTTENPEIETTTEPESEAIREENSHNTKDDKEKLSENTKVTTPEGKGVYYIYHPTNGVLQKVVYSTKNDEKEMALVAQLKYQNVEPIKEPIYTYNPETFVLQPLKLA
ncbi:uncharacterized protein LOC108741795 [Agrilus planipennis]|uniref:Uncharacterized protein LOC108741795 n=1 Tax=Agrilus planipennis TaxID=224129 RepID=A0A1W4XIM6_AGRPL|nr:uncharacterized protein LOC108741795 [Agrilus planipennis]